MSTIMAAQSTDRSVFALIGAFTGGLDVVKKLKKKRKRPVEVKPEDDEVRLSTSLQKAPFDIQSEYNRSYALQGERFREGDCTVLTALAAILAKLNNGLVHFISSFLAGGKKGKGLDYRSLTSLSETSKMEAIYALSQLSLRLSRSNLDLLKLSEPSSRQPKKKSDRTKRSNKPIPNNGTSAGYIKTANASTPQLAMIRPRHKRSSSTSSRSQGQPSPRPSIPDSPPPAYNRLPNRSTPNLQIHHPIITAPPPMPQPQYYPPPPSRNDFMEEVRRRRVDKTTPSMYTFASDSTKLGEIPMKNWTRPFDYEEMQKRNIAAAMGRSQQQLPVSEKKKRGFLGLFKRGNGAAVKIGA